MKLLIIFSTAVVILFGCNRNVPANGVAETPLDSVAGSGTVVAPSCIVEKIESIKQDHLWNPPAEIHEYEMAGKPVYAISADCCDRFTTVVDADCKYVCAPSGGFTGKGDGKCPEFFKNAKYIRLVWKDQRTKN
jgi:hypothetical protein